MFPFQCLAVVTLPVLSPLTVKCFLSGAFPPSTPSKKESPNTNMQQDKPTWSSEFFVSLLLLTSLSSCILAIFHRRVRTHARAASARTAHDLAKFDVGAQTRHVHSSKVCAIFSRTEESLAISVISCLTVNGALLPSTCGVFLSVVSELSEDDQKKLHIWTRLAHRTNRAWSTDVNKWEKV